MAASISILVIDDEYGVRSGISQILELEGYAVAVAETGRQALALLEDRVFDIALIDYQLPDLDGLTLLASMRERRLPTLTCMITAYANIDTAIAATRQGIDFFLPKPFSPDDLLGVIATLARHKRLKEDAEKLRKENERNLLALASEKSQTASLVASLRDAVLVVNREQEVALANQAMADLLGRPPGELVRMPVLQALAGEALAGLAELVAAGDGEGKVSELTLGDRVFVAGVTEFHDAEGAKLGRILTLADVTLLRKMAMEKPRFIRTMVHEFRSPLGAIRSLIEVAREKSLGEELAPYLPYLERADRRIDRLVELIGDLLSLSRIDLERASSAPAVADVGMAVSAIVDLYRPQIGERKLAASVSVATGLGRVRMGEDDLRTVLGNLVGNAIKYGRPGGSLTVTARADAGKIVIEVADSGIGIRPESLPRLFEEFFREKRSETRDIEGNGLGLAIVKRTVERVGGSVEVESVLGEGTTFRLRLPAA
ncbi:MAG: ATP-binding protein [Polyangia bacterium]|jgi:two-component system phosphate regulon sensor histidine kinase PhoR